MSDAPDLRIGVVGLGWMGQVHARAWSRLLQHYPDSARRPVLVAVADTVIDDRTRRAAASLGFGELVADWRELVARDDLDLVCVTGPNFIHREVGVAVAQSGKHLWIEKPAGRNAAETAEIAAAVDAAGVQSAAGFNYRNAPGVERAREIVASGRIGRIEHTTVRFLSDYAAHPDGALSWRFDDEFSGSGVLGDLVSHAVDLAEHVVGPIAELVADQATFIAERPEATPGALHYERGSGARGPVGNEDYVTALLRFADGSRGMLESSRVAVAEQNTYGFEIHGTTGAVAWDFRRLNELRTAFAEDYQNASWTTEYVTPASGEMRAFQPGAGNAMGFDDLKVIEAHRLVESIAQAKPIGATIHDALRAARTLDAVRASVAGRSWVNL
ncbi:Gfo/Idh/MocA family oxidoreductase [Aeromicrobium alkaliterrae]|uniref:Gfo/Idh/MocA family oxidoreductase n=1 Tax=Aeromicrobium alkaliterrae TaxID=302168 RepID=A0ABP4VTI9_9ACTN